MSTALRRTTFRIVLTLVTAAAAHAEQSFEIRSTTRVPGAILAPGVYTIAMADRLADRAILNIRDRNGRPAAAFLGVWSPAHKTGRSTSDVVIESGVLRAWYPDKNRPGLELVYPKADAIAIAQETGAAVLAIDPESERMNGASLSRRDMEIVTLWTLTPTRVEGQDSPGIAAAKFGTNPAPTPRTPGRMPDTASLETLWLLTGTLMLLGSPVAALRLGRNRLERHR